MAVYGTPCLFTWCDKLENLHQYFSNATAIDSPNYGPDSAFRNTHSACYSTTLGSLLHEFSHVLDIGHNSSGIMARGVCLLSSIFADHLTSTFIQLKLFKALMICSNSSSIARNVHVIQRSNQ